MVELSLSAAGGCPNRVTFHALFVTVPSQSGVTILFGLVLRSHVAALDEPLYCTRG